MSRYREQLLQAIVHANDNHVMEMSGLKSIRLEETCHREWM